MQVNVNASVSGSQSTYFIEKFIGYYYHITGKIKPTSHLQSIKLTQNSFDKCVTCLCSNSCQQSLFWTPFDGYNAKNKTGTSTDKERKKGLEILNRDAQNDGFSSISIRLSNSSQQFRFRSYLLDRWWWFNPHYPGVPRQQTATLNLSAVEHKHTIFCRF